jgi:hypothetical protein
MPEFGGKLDERLEYKPPFRHTRMRDLQLGRIDREAAEQQDIDVDISRPFGNGPPTPHLSFDVRDSEEQPHRVKLCAGLDDYVEELRLISHLYRLGLVERRHSLDLEIL